MGAQTSVLEAMKAEAQHEHTVAEKKMEASSIITEIEDNGGDTDVWVFENTTCHCWINVSPRYPYLDHLLAFATAVKDCELNDDKDKKKILDHMDHVAADAAARFEEEKESR